MFVSILSRLRNSQLFFWDLMESVGTYWSFRRRFQHFLATGRNRDIETWYGSPLFVAILTLTRERTVLNIDRKIDTVKIEKIEGG